MAAIPTMFTRPRGKRGRLGVLVAAAALAAAALIAPATPAHAHLGDLTCTANGTAYFDPPLNPSSTDAAVDASGQFVNCLSPNGSHPELQSAGLTASGTVTARGGVPCSLLLTLRATLIIAWSPSGEESEVDITVNTDPLNGSVTLSGPIVSGPMTGDTLTVLPVEGNPNPDCLTSGLTSLHFAAAQVVIG